MAFTFDPVFAVDPNNPANVAKGASITIFDPADPAQSPIAITDPTGSPLPNPITVDAAGMGPAYQHPTLARVGWKGAGFTGYFTSYEGMLNETIAAKAAAQASAESAATAGTNAAASVNAALASAVNDAAAASTAAVNAAALVGAPADTAIAAAVNGNGATKAALSASFASKVQPSTTYTAGTAAIAPTGELVTARANFTTGATYDPTKWEAKAVSKQRQRDEIRRRLADAFSRVALPAGFGWGAPITIYKGKVKYTTPFDVADFKNKGGATWYVDHLVGVNTNAGTSEAAPFKTLQKAYTSAASGDTIMIISKGTIGRPESWNGQRIKKSLNLIAKYPGEVNIAYADAHTYTLTVGQTKTYQTARTNVSKVIDMGAGAPGIGYDKVASIAAVEATPGTWFNDATNLYIHTANGVPPVSTKIIALLNGEHFRADSTDQEVKLYLEGINIYGGYTGNLLVEEINHPIDVYAKNCGFYWATGDVSASANSVNIAGARYTFFQKCTSMFSLKDGFNYTATNLAGALKTAPKFIEVDCVSAHHGLPNLVTPDTNNATTAHQGAVGVRIGGTYYGTTGAVVADVHVGTKSVNYSCTAFDPVNQNAGGGDAAFSAQQAGAEMWLYRCIGFGAAWDIYAVGSTTLHVDATEYDTRQGSGTFDITNPV